MIDQPFDTPDRVAGWEVIESAVDPDEWWLAALTDNRVLAFIPPGAELPSADTEFPDDPDERIAWIERAVEDPGDLSRMQNAPTWAVATYEVEAMEDDLDVEPLSVRRCRLAHILDLQPVQQAWEFAVDHSVRAMREHARFAVDSLEGINANGLWSRTSVIALSLMADAIRELDADLETCGARTRRLQDLYDACDELRASLLERMNEHPTTPHQWLAVTLQNAGELFMSALDLERAEGPDWHKSRHGDDVEEAWYELVDHCNIQVAFFLETYLVVGGQSADEHATDQRRLRQAVVEHADAQLLNDRDPVEWMSQAIDRNGQALGKLAADEPDLTEAQQLLAEAAAAILAAMASIGATPAE